MDPSERHEVDKYADFMENLAYDPGHKKDPPVCRARQENGHIEEGKYRNQNRGPLEGVPKNEEESINQKNEKHV